MARSGVAFNLLKPPRRTEVSAMPLEKPSPPSTRRKIRRGSSPGYMLNDWWLDNRLRPVSSENCSNLNESSRPIAQPASLDAPKRSVVTESFVPKTAVAVSRLRPVSQSKFLRTVLLRSDRWQPQPPGQDPPLGKLLHSRHSIQCSLQTGHSIGATAYAGLNFGYPAGAVSHKA